MRALVLRRFGEPLVLEERPAPVPRANQMLVRVRAARICGSDVHIAAGRVRVELPLVLGHEVTGTCDELGEVLVYAARGCGRCRYCRAGKEQLCPEAAEAGWARDGGFAETVLFPAGRHLFPLDGLDPAQAAPLADASVTAYRAVHRATDSLGRNTIAVVIGAGGLGQFAIQYLRLLTDAHTRRPHCRDQRRGCARRRGRWTAQL
jgi:alcohol dehydrogenase, propanol-preferring